MGTMLFNDFIESVDDLRKGRPISVTEAATIVAYRERSAIIEAGFKLMTDRLEKKFKSCENVVPLGDFCGR